VRRIRHLPPGEHPAPLYQTKQLLTEGQNEQGMLAKAVRLNAVLVTTCRCLDIFHGRHTLPEHLQECALTFWLAEEQLHRCVIY
jgi:hypothetical protein